MTHSRASEHGLHQLIQFCLISRYAIGKNGVQEVAPAPWPCAVLSSAAIYSLPAIWPNKSITCLSSCNLLIASALTACMTNGRSCVKNGARVLTIGSGRGANTRISLVKFNMRLIALIMRLISGRVVFIKIAVQHWINRLSQPGAS